MSVYDKLSYKACKKRLQNVRRVFILSVFTYITYINKPELNSSYHCTMKCASSIGHFKVARETGAVLGGAVVFCCL